MRLLQSIHYFDLLAFGWCLRRKHRKMFIALSRLISKTADGPLYVLSAVIMATYNYWHIVIVLAVGFSIERLIYFIAKQYFRRNRPPQVIPGFQSVIQPSDQFSFPSGHTSAAFLITGLLCTFFPPLCWGLYPWAIAVGTARVMLGVHFPSDILAGALLGHLLSLAALSISTATLLSFP